LAVRQQSIEEALELALATCAPAPPASLHWRAVERMVGDAFRRQGYIVTGFGGTRSEGVVADIGLVRNGERFLVQCQHWRKMRVGIAELIELSRLVTAQGARGGFVVTTGQFSAEAWDFAHGASLVLYDERSLAWLLTAQDPVT
jgi:restriction system protein